jgi:hypothetical protein
MRLLARRGFVACRTFIALSLILWLTGPAFAKSCAKSSEYILDGLAGDLAKPAAHYQDLLKICEETLTISNVDDAYVLKNGSIAIKPRRNTAIATAETLAQFCQRFPNRSARFLTPGEQRKGLTVGLVVMMPSGNATSCSKIRDRN